MPKRYAIYRHQQSALARNAFLCNCRDRDLREAAGSSIPSGSIVRGEVGMVVAEQDLPGYVAEIVPFRANALCKWQKRELKCMVRPELLEHPDKPRAYNYAVAELHDSEAADMATALGLPVIDYSEGKKFVNLELAVFPRQNKDRRAKLVRGL